MITVSTYLAAVNLKYSLPYSYWKPFLCPKYNSTYAIHSEDYWLNVVPVSQTDFARLNRQQEKKARPVLVCEVLVFPNVNHWPMLLGTSFVTLGRWRSERMKLMKWNHDFTAAFSLIIRLSGRKAQDDLNFFLKSLGNIKLIWVGSTAT